VKASLSLTTSVKYIKVSVIYSTQLN